MIHDDTVILTDNKYKKYKWLLFDADNTLLDFDRAERDALTEALADQDVIADTDMIDTYSAINDTLWKSLERGEIEKSRLKYQRFEELNARCELSIDTVLLAESYLAHLSTKTYLCPGALELCETLYGKYEFYIITNGIKSVQQGRFGGCAIKQMFIRSFISEEMGSEKPSREFFDGVASAIPGFDRSRALVIGDSLTSDISGGIAYGIDTCWFNRKHQKIPENMKITYVVDDLMQIPPLLGE